MTYNRVIPRDLFNEGNLLKCYGQLYLNLEKMGLESWLIHEETDKGFIVDQDVDGNLLLRNVTLEIGGFEDGIPVHLHRPLNSRRPYPLYVYPDLDEEIEVFNDDGSFTQEMIDFLRKGINND